MELVKGLIVKSIAGHDKDTFQIVMGFEKDYALVCDGKKRVMEKLKRKNTKHLQLTKTVLNQDAILSNSSIRKALKKYQES